MIEAGASAAQQVPVASAVGIFDTLGTVQDLLPVTVVMLR
jgi:hypothetical protein